MNPERFGAYTLLEKLGQGGMAVVYRGERVGEAGFKKRVAIKRILPQYRRDPSLLERFAAEARTNARLDHPNLVQVLDFGIEPEPYLALELIEGVSLSQVMQRLLARNEKLELSAMLFIVAEVANGLDHAHRKRGDDGTPLGIVHRDISPQNVLLSNEGAVKVSDFGLVKAADNVIKTASGISIGKLSYMAPEQADGRGIDARADLFALGVTMWEMLTLRSLIPPDDPAKAAVMIQRGGFDPPSRFRPDVPPELDRVVMHCLAIDLDARMPSAQQLGAELREMLHERAAGYDRQQLARMLGWLFPEKGWSLPEPHEPAVQPSDEERASMMPVTPAIVAMARRSNSDPPAPPAPLAGLERGVVAPLPADAPIPTTPHAPAGASAARESTPRASLPSEVPAHAQARSARAPHGALVLALLALLGSLALASIGVVSLGLTGWHYASQPHRGTLRVESSTPGLSLYLGPTRLGDAPLDVEGASLVGQPLVAVARGHEPRIVRAERLAELVEGGDHVERIELTPSASPSAIVYVRYDGQGTAYDATTALGPVPGALRVQVGRTTELRVVDDVTGRATTLPVGTCEAGAVCVREAR